MPRSCQPMIVSGQRSGGFPAFAAGEPGNPRTLRRVAVRCTFFRDGAAVDAGEDAGEARARFAGSPGYLWVHLSEPDAAEVAALGREFGLHRLALEDISSAH